MRAVVVIATLTVLATGVWLAARSSGGEQVKPKAHVVGPDLPVTAMDGNLEPASNSPSIVADPTDDRFVVIANRIDSPGFSCDLQASGDGGLTWVSATPVFTLPEGVERCYAPEAAFDAKGVLHYVFVGLKGAGNEPVGVFLMSSPDRARTWTTPRQVLGPLNFAVRMVIDQSHGKEGRMHLVWLKASSDPPLGGFGPPPNPILAAHSDDGGKTFSAPVQVSGHGGQLVVAPSVALGENNAIYVAYYDLQQDTRDYLGLEGPVWDRTWSVEVATSTNGGKSFAKGVVVEDKVAPPSRPMLIYTLAPPALVADDQGRVCTAWTDARHGDADALVACSGWKDQRGWSAPKRLNDDDTGNGSSQYLPQLGLTDDGRLDAIFYDRRGDPANVAVDVFYTFSTNGARSFRPNTRLTSESFDSRIGQQYTNVSAQGQFDPGSRLGVLSGPDKVLTAWADARNSVVTSTAQDLFSTTVNHARPKANPKGRPSSLPPAVPQVRVAMEDNRFEFDPKIPAGRVVFLTDNTGSDEHRLDLIPLADDMPPIDAQLRGDQRRQVSSVANVTTRRPGQSGSFAVDLVAGRRYALVCFVRDSDGRIHAVKGMNAEFRAGRQRTEK
ncbi:MAG TPA: sialidase family protein [Acidimicrobiales bacterium]|nr:sialidase family protein [Acidimicrobiales bacterium]